VGGPRRPLGRRPRGAIALGAVLAAIALSAIAPAPAAATTTDPLFAFTPTPPAPPPTIPLPNGYLNGPCGLAVDSGGRFYIADHYHDAVDVYNGAAAYSAATASGATGYITQLSLPDPERSPCYLALNSGGELYVGDYHGTVSRYTPAAYPPTAGAEPPQTGTPYTLAGQVDPGPATGIAVDPSTDDLYVAHREGVSVYDPAGNPVMDGPDPLQIGIGSLEDGYGLAVSTAGKVYVADAAGDEVEVYDPADGANFPDQPSATISGPPSGFASLRDAALALDQGSGRLYVLDDTQPAHAEQPRGRVQIFNAAGTYLGHLKYDVIDGAPSGLAANATGRVYVSSGNTYLGGIYAYGPEAQSAAAPLAPTIPPTPLGGEQLFPPVPIGAAAAPPGGIACEGDNCQVLPPEPTDPTLTTLLTGLGNTPPRYKRYRHPAKSKGKGKNAKGAKGNGKARASAVAPTASTPAPIGMPPAKSQAPASSAPAAQGLLAGAEGFDASAYANGGAAATQAGSHPYSLDFSLGLDQSGGESDLRGLRMEMPPGLLFNPAFSSTLCSAAAFETPRSSPYESSQSGEGCPNFSQVGTIEVGSGGGQTRRFGLFELEPAAGSAFRLGAAPFGHPLLFDAEIHSDEKGTYTVLEAAEVPASLALQSLELALWGAPWDASHNTERGNCLNEAEPTFGWAKCSVGDPTGLPPRAFLTLPVECRPKLAFQAQVSSWQEAGTESVSALSRDPGGEVAPIEACSSLTFNPTTEGFLSVKKASSASGYAFRLSDEDPGLADPRRRIHAPTKEAVVELPKGVTLNPSLGAGLETCSPAQLANETAFNPPGAGCPNGAKIGDFSVRVPFYEGLLNGGVYLAKPHDNPSATLLAVYLIAKSADRGALISVPGKLVPDPGDGTLTAIFDDLPQLPYTDLEVNFKSGQRAPLVSPPGCGWATTSVTLDSWAQGAPTKSANSKSPITSGIDFGPCPDGQTPPFSPGAISGGVNANVGSYTPYYVHLSRKDTEQEITSYSLVLPKGITGKIAGIPFCPDAAIEAARRRSGVEETASPSCPGASEVGRTLTGYGVGPALTYAPGRIYLAGPYHGSALSLVTINAATVGPFDLGTIVIRSAFDINPRTAQLQIDPGASDPIPHIREGIVLHLRDIRIYMDRPQFTHNPSSCEPSALESTLSGSGASFEDQADDSSATVSKHFQLLNCLTLGFRPNLGLRLRGGSKRGSFPSLRASFVSRGAKDSNLKRMEVVMPHALFLAQQHIHTVCTRPQFAASSCPAGSVYGRAVASTPLFDEPLRGNVYLRSSTHRFPDLVADLHSGSIHIVVEGEIGPSKEGGFRAFFDNLPDAPIERFTMTFFGGKRGLLTNSVNICTNPPLASVKGLAQNNIGAIFTSQLRGQCDQKKGKGKGRGKRHHHRARGGSR
jgi:hypothetical protein